MPIFRVLAAVVLSSFVSSNLCAQKDDLGQGYKPPKLVTARQLLSEVNDGVASELRYILHAQDYWTFFGGIMGDEPRDRRAFGRLLSEGDVELFLKLAYCDNPAAAAYGCSGVYTLAPERLPELLQLLVSRCDAYDLISGDIGGNHDFSEFAVHALAQLSTSKDRERLEAAFESWLSRLAFFEAGAGDLMLAEAFVEKLSPRRVKTLDLADVRLKPLLPLVVDLAKSYNSADSMRVRIGGAADGGLERIVLCRLAVHIFPMDLKEAGVAKLKLAMDGTYDSVADERDEATVWFQLIAQSLHDGWLKHGALRWEFIDVLRTYDADLWQKLRTHKVAAIARAAEQMYANPLVQFVESRVAPSQPEARRAWLYFWMRSTDEQRPDVIDDALADEPALVLSVSGNEAHAANREFESIRWNPRSDKKLPRSWAVMAASKNAEVRKYFLQDAYRCAWQFKDDYTGGDKEYAKKIINVLEQISASDDVEVRWLARRAYICILGEMGDNPTKEGSRVLALANAWMVQLAADLLANPRVVLDVSDILSPIRNYEWDWMDARSGRDGSVNPEDMQALVREPHWELVMTYLLEPCPFEYPAEEPRSLTLEEMRKVEPPAAEYFESAKLKLKNIEVNRPKEKPPTKD